MADHRIRSIVIVGGGTAGWLAASVLGRTLRRDYCDVRLIDLPQAHPTELSEATVPAIHRLINLLGLDETDLVRRTEAAFSLGVEFADWSRPGSRYFHAFGSIGARLETVPFHHYWLKLRRAGEAQDIDAFSTAMTAAKRGRFARPLADSRSVLSLYSYAYHFNAPLLAKHLSEYAIAHGVTRVAREVVEAKLRGEDGFIESLLLDDGSHIAADFFIDCSGPRGVLIESALKTGCEDWTDWLPCDRAVSMPCAGDIELPPYSQAIACDHGWQRRVPLRNCIDSGYVYCSRFASDDEATGRLLADAPGRALAEPRVIRFAAGPPRKFWNRNCLALPGAAIEPLESMRLQLVQTGITRLLTTFPDRRFYPADAEEYNRLTHLEHERIRDFLILHYKATARQGSPLWDHCRNMEVPESLGHKIELFRQSGRVGLFDDEHFGVDSWLTVFLGQQILPLAYDPTADVLDTGEVKAALARMQSMISAGVESLPTHREYLERFCAVEPTRTS